MKISNFGIGLFNLGFWMYLSIILMLGANGIIPYELVISLFLYFLVLKVQPIKPKKKRRVIKKWVK